VEIIEIRWHGRGGQGAITAAKIVASAAFESGYPGVVMAPTFGTERRGAPIFTSLKLSKKKIRDLSPIVTPDMVVVLDQMLLAEADVTNGLKSGGLFVLNTTDSPDAYKDIDARVATVDITSIAVEAGLPKGVVNSGVIGAFVKASGLVDIDLAAEFIQKEFAGKKPENNVKAAMLAYDRTLIGGK